MAGQAALLRPVQSMGVAVGSNVALSPSFSLNQPTALQAARLSWRVVTERPGKKYMSKAARIVAGIGTGAGERWSVRQFGSEPQGKVQAIAADTHMRAPIPVAETEAGGYVCDTPAAGVGSLVGTSTAGHRAGNQVPFSLTMFEQEILCIVCKLYACSSFFEVSDLC
jgi:hypothetical protein